MNTFKVGDWVKLRRGSPLYLRFVMNNCAYPDIARLERPQQITSINKSCGYIRFWGEESGWFDHNFELADAKPFSLDDYL